MIATGRISHMRKLVDAARADGRQVGFVPTMGALHEGHRSLIRRARTECGFVVVSIFVNPAQFGPHEDLDAYPRTFADDLDACIADGVDVVFHPEAHEIYPDGLSTTISVGGVIEPMEGRMRPGHFAGVALVCAKLFNIIGACNAYFGEKDAQQVRVVSRMVRDLDMPVEIVCCETVRDPDGLAMSSRNKYLKAGDRERALVLPRALRTIESCFASGEENAAELASAGRRVLEADPPDAVDYLEIVDPQTLQPLERIGSAALVCAAIRIGNTRLIDNLTLRGNA